MKRNKKLVFALAAVSAFSSLNAFADNTSTQSAPASETQASKFGLSLGMGVLLATGNRGALWQPAEPTYDLTVLYWLTNQLAIGIEGSDATDSYRTNGVSGGQINVGITHLEFNARVYGNLHTLVPSIGFISPFLTVGGGAFLESQTAVTGGLLAPQDLEMGMTLGAGLRFTIIPQSVSFEALGRWDSVSFKDSYTNQFQASNGLPNLYGQFFSVNGNLVIAF